MFCLSNGRTRTRKLKLLRNGLRHGEKSIKVKDNITCFYQSVNDFQVFLCMMPHRYCIGKFHALLCASLKTIFPRSNNKWEVIRNICYFKIIFLDQVLEKYKSHLANFLSFIVFRFLLREMSILIYCFHFS